MPEADIRPLRESGAQFAVDLYKVVCLESGEENVMLSELAGSLAPANVL